MSTAQTALLGVRVICEQFRRPQASKDNKLGRFLGFARLSLPQVGLILNDVQVFEQTRRGQPERMLLFPARSFEAHGIKQYIAAVDFRNPAARSEFKAAALRAIDEFEARQQAAQTSQ